MDPIVLSSNSKIEISEKSVVFIIFCENHWITLSRKNNEKEWSIYDSLNSIENLKFVKDVLRKIVGKEKQVIINLVKVQNQVNSNDCGLFAIAFTISLCLGKNPADIFYFQSKMRAHYNNCIEIDDFKEFPFIDNSANQVIDKILLTL